MQKAITAMMTMMTMIDTIAAMMMPAGDDGAADVSMHAVPTSGMIDWSEYIANTKCQLQGHLDNLMVPIGDGGGDSPIET